MTAFALRNILPTALLSLSLLASTIAGREAHAQSSATRKIQDKIDTLQKQQMASQKQAALKKATVKIAEQRVAELEKQLQQARKRIQVAAEELKQAEAMTTAKGKEIAIVAPRLEANKKADALVAKAQSSQELLKVAEKRQAKLTDQLAKLQQAKSQEQKRVNEESAALKLAKESLPKKLEELKALRTTYDDLAIKVDLASSAANLARKNVKAAKAETAAAAVRVASAKAAEADAVASLDSLKASLAKIQAAAKTSGAAEEEAGGELKKSIVALQPMLDEAAKVVELAVAQWDGKKIAETDAAKQLLVAQNKLKDIQTNHAKQSRLHFQHQLTVADLQNAERAHAINIAAAAKQQETLAAKEKTLLAQISANADEVDKLRNEYVTKQKAAEVELEALDRFVSFSRHIAPIFAKRCVACHNTRTASGRLNMDSFAALVKGGESGAAFAAHDSTDSLLVMMIEDGSMPKDADPLAAEEIALVKKWIDVGAPLDAGTVASADLFQVIPEIAQPLPPESYRVPIPVTATALNSEASILASSGYHEVLLWNTADGKLLRRITNVAERVYDLEFTGDGSQLIVAAGTPGQLGEVKIFSTVDGSHIRTLVRTKDAVFAVALSPNGKQIAAGGADRIVYTMEFDSGKQLLQIEDHADWVMDVNWSPDGLQLVTASRDKTSKVFDSQAGSSKITFNGHGNAVYTAAFLSTGQGVVSGGSDHKARIWNVADAKEVRKIGGFGHDIFRLVVSPDNHMFSASADRNAREHNLKDGKIVRTFAGHKDWVYTLCVNPAKQLIATGSYDGEIRVWNSTDGSVATSFIAIPQAVKNATVAASGNSGGDSAE